jgi:phosphoribosylamine--glycine ligase
MITGGSSLVIEEKFDARNFHCSVCATGKMSVATPLVQDHKRRFDGDKGRTPAAWGRNRWPTIRCLSEAAGFKGRAGNIPARSR